LKSHNFERKVLDQHAIHDHTDDVSPWLECADGKNALTLGHGLGLIEGDLSRSTRLDAGPHCHLRLALGLDDLRVACLILRAIFTFRPSLAAGLVDQLHVGEKLIEFGRVCRASNIVAARGGRAERTG